MSKLRDEASKLEVHHKKMKIKQKRVEKQVQKAENVENEKSEKEKVEASIKLYSFNEYVSNSVYTLSPQLITGGGGGGHHLPKKNPKKVRGDEAPLALSSRGRRTLLLFNCWQLCTILPTPHSSIRHIPFRYKSSLLPLDREIPDIRIQECKGLEWDVAAMPKTSIIICFVDESWSALLYETHPHQLFFS